MKRASLIVKTIFGALLMAAIVNTEAMSLGRMRGVAIVGRPLEVTLVGQLAESGSIADVCFAADVFFGDSQLPVGRVNSLTSAGTSVGEVLIRIRTTSAVDEPVVTLYVREGCVQKTTRKYVLLAEVFPDNVETNLVVGEVVVARPATVGTPSAIPSAAVAKTAVPARVATINPVDSAKPGKSSANKGKAAPPGRVGSRSPMAATTTPPVAARAATKSKSEPNRKPPGSRLKLDPLDMLAERDPVLRPSRELLTAPAVDPKQRTAAAAFWQALNAQPEDKVRDAERLKTLEAEVAAIAAQNRHIDKVLMEVSAELKQARSERYSNWLVYLLGVLLAMALATASFLWGRNRQQKKELANSPWWRQGAAEPGSKGGPRTSWNDLDVASVLPPSAEKTKVKVDIPAPAVFSLDEEAAQPLQDEHKTVRISRPAAPSPSSRKSRSAFSKDSLGFSPSLSMASLPRVVNAEELFDVQQQADFFLSLGDPEKAVEILHQHIGENVETSALAYLDLFDLYHMLKRKADYELLRGDFNRIFNAQVPTFDDFTSDVNGLESYPSALSRIESLWPSSKVLHVLEESLFRRPDSGTEAFGMAAYRELLLLHGIAKNIIDRPEAPSQTLPPGTSQPLSFDELAPLFAPAASAVAPASGEVHETKLQPLSAGLAPGGIDLNLTHPRPSSRLGLDIDLSQPMDESTLTLSKIASVKDAIESSAQQEANPDNFTLDKLDFWRIR